MCGIVGYIGQKVVDEQLVEALKHLEYRGYDSAGIAEIDNNKIIITKAEGKISNLEGLLKKNNNSYCGIAYTRWATHGKPTINNAHPILSDNGEWAVVHNGIIENFGELKSEIRRVNNIKFVSDTDTEVIPQMLQITSGETLMEKLIAVCKRLRGSYALACLNSSTDKVLYLAKKKSPLYVAINGMEVFVASDPICFCGEAINYYSLEDDEFCKAEINNLMFYDINGIEITKTATKLSEFEVYLGKQKYSHFMQKEIEEVPSVLKRIVNTYRDNNAFQKFDKDFVRGINKIVFIGCGTAYHAGLMGVSLIEKIARIECRAYVSSEFRYSNPILDEHTLCVFVSQSGETADTIAAHDLAKEKGATTIALTNVLYSALAKKADIILPVCAGPEIAVASTKAYSAQITILYMLAKHLSSVIVENNEDYLAIINKLVSQIQKIDKIDLNGLVQELKEEKQAFFIGRDVDYITSEEASLKLKEITYINSCAYPSGELKHGFLALVEEGTFLFVIATQKALLDKTLNAAHEAYARGAKIVLVTGLDVPVEKMDGVYKTIKLPDLDNDLMPIVSIGVFQKLSYLVSVAKGFNPDQPRNLAKSVTVE